mmetsp:Transcript_6996/g.21295  ORF Transcript_6996/g.21295 Transcript_6996/m.21295 type:complete len:523 (-) Transcript_6996:1564-3132(-)|eukprot:CAMPEP_0198737574 /NCGR_PEP_ID=MMETSP1475-20131203/67936_1 /TAXON_ID= ORGANISM="Unidentified sp., Strain CCMP1999" /NCGR_SAMPLE_ID=MMETSP1475 /ASSEMBLY_ACC=CAM_ASM_001111 /LENGTH=522 /DNA_ID=CAMNT_0044501441 /DNA_START=269 /DNA_END=1837 /DNA_ORIENTATION=+
MRDDGCQVLGELRSWCNDRGFQVSSKVELAVINDVRGRGARAAAKISCGEELFRVPSEWRISGVAEKQDLTWLERTAIALERERRKGSKSPFAPYIAFLNSVNHAAFHQPIRWSDEDFKELRGTSIERYIGRDTVDKRFETVMEQHLSTIGLKMPFDDWLKLTSVVQAYGFAGETDSRMVVMTPLADVLNASVTLNNARAFCVELSSDDEDSSSEDIVANLVIRATKDIEPGEEIFNTFGKLSNGELLRNYGFVEAPVFDMPENPYDEVEIPGDVVRSEVDRVLSTSSDVLRVDSRSISRRQFLREYCDFVDLEDCSYPINLRKTGQRSLRSLRALLRCALMSDDEANSLFAETGDNMHLGRLSLQRISREDDVQRSIANIAESQLAAYPTSFDGDVAALDGRVGIRKQLALVVRTGEKRLLRGMADRALHLRDEDSGEDDSSSSSSYNGHSMSSLGDQSPEAEESEADEENAAGEDADSSVDERLDSSGKDDTGSSADDGAVSGTGTGRKRKRNNGDRDET